MNIFIHNTAADRITCPFWYRLGYPMSSCITGMPQTSHSCSDWVPSYIPRFPWRSFMRHQELIPLVFYIHIPRKPYDPPPRNLCSIWHNVDVLSVWCFWVSWLLFTIQTKIESRWTDIDVFCNFTPTSTRQVAISVLFFWHWSFTTDM